MDQASRANERQHSQEDPLAPLRLPEAELSERQEIIHSKESSDFRIQATERNSYVTSLRIEFLRDQAPFLTYSLNHVLPKYISHQLLSAYFDQNRAPSDQILTEVCSLASMRLNQSVQLEIPLSPEHDCLKNKEIKGIFPDLRDLAYNQWILKGLHFAERTTPQGSEAIVARIHRDLGIVMVATSEQTKSSALRVFRVRTALAAGEPINEHNAFLEDVVAKMLARFKFEGCSAALAPLLRDPSLVDEISAAPIKSNTLRRRIHSWAAGEECESPNSPDIGTRRSQLLIGAHEAVLRYIPPFQIEPTIRILFSMPEKSYSFSAPQLDYMESLRDMFASGDERRVRTVWSELVDDFSRFPPRTWDKNSLTATLSRLVIKPAILEYGLLEHSFDGHDRKIQNLPHIGIAPPALSTDESVTRALYGVRAVHIILDSDLALDRPDFFSSFRVEVYPTMSRVVTLRNGLGGVTSIKIPEGTHDVGPLLVDLCTRFSQQAERGWQPLLQACEETRRLVDEDASDSEWDCSTDGLPRATDIVGVEMIRKAGQVVALLRSATRKSSIDGEVRILKDGACELRVIGLNHFSTLSFILSDYAITRLAGRTRQSSSTGEEVEREVCALEDLSVSLLEDDSSILVVAVVDAIETRANSPFIGVITDEVNQNETIELFTNVATALRVPLKVSRLT